MPERKKIFISYSHQDKAWLKRLQVHLRPLESSLEFDIWDDTRIRPGSNWEEEIENAIDQAKVAILLISANFLASDFITTNELPPLLDAAKKGGVLILFVIVSPSGFLRIKSLSQFQTVNDPNRPLIKMTRSDREAVFDKIAAYTEDWLKRSFPQSDPLIEPGSSTSFPVEPSKSTIADNESRKHARRVFLRSLRKWPTMAILLSALLIWIAAAIVIDGSHCASSEYNNNRESFLKEMPWLTWIVYDPTDYDPYQNREASEESIRKDLMVLRNYGFDGLITITSRGTNQNIPRIARQAGFIRVIAGVWEPRDENEVANALRSAPYVDAYCLGNDGLNRRYTMEELQSFIEKFKCETNRPVTTTEIIEEYEINPKLLEIGDFLFPDVHTQWRKGQTPQQAWAETVAWARRAAELVAHNPGRLVLLKMISYPSGGADLFSPQTQKEFYRLAVEEAVNETNIPTNVYFSFMTAFDPEWKTEEYEWEKPEQYTGLFTRDRLPKLSITQVRWRKRKGN